MHRNLVVLGIIGSLFFASCSSDKTGIHAENGTTTSGVMNDTDSSTTNPVNSEYGTPNASENTVDSTQNANKGSK